MGVYIKGMKIPKQDRVTLQIGADGAVYVVDKCEITAEKYEKNFEVFEVPPHGRLIDADALKSYMEECKGENAMAIYATGYARSFIDKAQTVIPADKGGET